jgi:hypothetical protein
MVATDGAQERASVARVREALGAGLRATLGGLVAYWGDGPALVCDDAEASRLAAERHPRSQDVVLTRYLADGRAEDPAARLGATTIRQY